MFSAFRAALATANQIKAGRPSFWPEDMVFPTTDKFKGAQDDDDVLELLLQKAASDDCPSYNLEAVAEAIAGIECVQGLSEEMAPSTSSCGRQ